MTEYDTNGYSVLHGPAGERDREGGVHMSDASSWHSYPSIFALGHRAVADLFDGPVLVEEKIDGSQFSFGRFDGELRCRSKGAVLNLIAPEAMFREAIETATALDLRDGWTYRAEYLKKPKHNTLAYDRIPIRHLMIFDVNAGDEVYLSYDEKATEAARIGLEVVPRIIEGVIEDVTTFRALLDATSILGGQKIEGVVVKNYARFGPDKKALMGKFVSERFKETHAAEWRKENPKSGDVVQNLIRVYATPARYQKAMQHLAEAGRLEGSPRDIGLLLKETAEDIERECAEEISRALYQWAWPQIRRGAVAGVPQWYKDRLVERQFEEAAE